MMTQEQIDEIWTAAVGNGFERKITRGPVIWFSNGDYEFTIEANDEMLFYAYETKQIIFWTPGDDIDLLFDELESKWNEIKGQMLLDEVNFLLKS